MKVNPASTVSVVIPTYNSASFLEKTLLSVQQQTLETWEAWIIDGGSEDETCSIAEAFSQRDPRFQLTTQRGGVSYSRNRGAELAQGNYIAFLDSDDLWYPERLTRHIAHLEANPEVGISFSRAEFIHSDGSTTGQLSSGRLHDLQPESLFYENPTITMSNIIVRTEIMKQIHFDSSMSYSEDLEWLFRVMYVGGWQIEGLSLVLLQYRTNEKGLSAHLERMEAGWNYFLCKAKHLAPDLVDQHYATAQAVHLRYLARRAVRLGLSAQIARDYSDRALASDWRILVTQPRRTLLTLAAVYGLSLLSVISTPQRG